MGGVSHQKQPLEVVLFQGVHVPDGLVLQGTAAHGIQQGDALLGEPLCETKQLQLAGRLPPVLAQALEPREVFVQEFHAHAFILRGGPDHEPLVAHVVDKGMSRTGDEFRGSGFREELLAGDHRPEDPSLDPEPLDVAVRDGRSAHRMHAVRADDDVAASLRPVSQKQHPILGVDADHLLRRIRLGFGSRCLGILQPVSKCLHEVAICGVVPDLSRVNR